MPPRTASTSRPKHKSTLKFESPPPKKFKAAKDVTILSVRGYTFKVFPLTQYIPKLSQRPVLKPGNKPPSSAPLLSNVVELDSATVKDAKGKGKAKSTVHEGPGTLQLVTRLLKADSLLQDDRLWADKYEPQSPGDLAVHKRKVDDVRRWLVEAFNEQDRSERSVCSLLIRLTTRWLEFFPAPAHPHWPRWFWQDDDSTHARKRNELRNNRTQDSCEYGPSIGFYQRDINV